MSTVCILHWKHASFNFTSVVTFCHKSFYSALKLLLRSIFTLRQLDELENICHLESLYNIVQNIHVSHFCTTIQNSKFLFLFVKNFVYLTTRQLYTPEEKDFSVCFCMLCNGMADVHQNSFSTPVLSLLSSSFYSVMFHPIYLCSLGLPPFKFEAPRPDVASSQAAVPRFTSVVRRSRFKKILVSYYIYIALTMLVTVFFPILVLIAT